MAMTYGSSKGSSGKRPTMSKDPVRRVAAAIQARNSQRVKSNASSLEAFEKAVSGLSQQERRQLDSALGRLDRLAAERYISESKARKNQSRPSAASSTSKRGYKSTGKSGVRPSAASSTTKSAYTSRRASGQTSGR